VGAGSRAFVDPPDRSMLRISVTQLPIDPALIGELADYIAEAARSSSREFFD
jgi:hypothetical protein